MNYLWRKRPCDLDKLSEHKVSGLSEAGGSSCGGRNGMGMSTLKSEESMAAANLTVRSYM